MIRLLWGFAFILASSSLAFADDWTLLTAQDATSNGACQALQESSPVKEYLDVYRCSDDEGQPKLKWVGCKPKGFYKEFQNDCARDPLKCSFIAKALEGKPTPEHLKLFRGLLLMHDRKLVENIVGAASYGRLFGGSCLGGIDPPHYEALIGLAAVGTPEDVKILNTLIDDDWKIDKLGKDLRQRIATAYWHLGQKSAEKELMKLMDLKHVKRFPGREFRTTILMTLAEWKSDAAVELCSENLRDLKDKDLEACMMYLARRGVKKSGKQMVRYIERAPKVGVLALGRLGGAASKKYLKQQRAKNKDVNSAYIDVSVASLMAGDGRAWSMIPKVLKKHGRPSPATLNTLAYLRGTKYARKTIGLLKKHERKWKKDHSATYARSVAVRAHLGDKNAVKQLIGLLDSTERDVRSEVVASVGARWGGLHEYTPGYGVVADARLLSALAEAHKNEADERLRSEMAAAALNIRAVLRARK